MGEVRRGFFEKVSKAGGFEGQFGRAEKCLNRWLVSKSDEEFTREILKAGVGEEATAEIVQSTKEAVLKAKEAVHKGRPVDVKIKTDKQNNTILTVRDTKFNISSTQWDKLRRQYRWDDDKFEQCVALMMLRYRCLTGGRSGLQDAVPKEVMGVLQRRLDVEVEGFASPINSELGCFCSMFPETDVVFGSLGSFWDFSPTSGSIEVNPPFTEQVMADLDGRITALLTATPHPLSFTLIIPEWTDPPTPSITSIRANPHDHLRLDLTIRQGTHTYTDGLSGLPTPPFVRNTLILVLMNDAGYAKWGPNLPLLKEDLVDCWECDENPAKKRRVE
eukprot:TRINITY_DN21597_c0_g1_i1.p1 TRINITY_DN21597_c0_g1~~TRINITY_DN21597_c0_g1_i1.p1  ORF type:complete len:378 (+),score=113.97 TRINITY_DN21597_c0_g1_i1:141-1136(+)